MPVRQNKRTGIWTATIDFENTYAKKGKTAKFDTRYEAEDWLKAVKREFGKKK